MVASMLISRPGRFGGQDITGANAILAEVTYRGDTNLDHAVNFNDLLALAKNYNQTLSAADLATASSYSADFAGDWALAGSWCRFPACRPG